MSDQQSAYIFLSVLRHFTKLPLRKTVQIYSHTNKLSPISSSHSLTTKEILSLYCKVNRRKRECYLLTFSPKI